MVIQLVIQVWTNYTSAWSSPVNLLHIFRNSFPKNTSGLRLLQVRNTFRYPENIYDRALCKNIKQRKNKAFNYFRKKDRLRLSLERAFADE